MKTLFIFSLLSLVLFASCAKKIECIGADCTLPEAVVAVDSLQGETVYVTLVNSAGASFIYPLFVSSEVNTTELLNYLNGPQFCGLNGRNECETDRETRKVYYISNDQSYVMNNATYINAFQTRLEIVAFGDGLQLTN